jgi:uncharacterized membrane protein
MMSAYLAIKLVHIFLAITALGANLTYGVWFALAARRPALAVPVMRGIKLIDDYIANPAYVLMLPTGALMVWLGGLGFGTRWIAASMSLWLVAMLLGFLGYSPLLRQQIAAAEREGPDAPATRAVARRANVVTVLLALDFFAILILMVFKPALG